MDLYGIKSSIMEANTLHGQEHARNEIDTSELQGKIDTFNNTLNNQRQSDSRKNDEQIAEQSNDIMRAHQVGQTLHTAGKGIAEGYGEMRTVAGRGTSLQAGLTTGLGRASAAGGKGAATFAEAAKGKMTGVEGIGQKVLGVAGAGEKAAFVGGKLLGNVGAIVDAGSQIDDLIQTGNIFKSKDASGKTVKESGTDIAGSLLTEAGAGLDVLSAFTGGLLVPFAAAVNLAGAAVSGTAAIEDEKAGDKSTGKKPTAKSTGLGAPISEAYTSLGMVGNISHNPITNV